eukprot:1410457-Alexandrium_andersonii.AAC.1
MTPPAPSVSENAPWGPCGSRAQTGARPRLGSAASTNSSPPTLVRRTGPRCIPAWDPPAAAGPPLSGDAAGP